MITQWLESHITLHSHDSPREEIANSVTHGLGALLSLLALFAMQGKLHQSENTPLTAIIGCAIYGIAMFLTYASSSIYHYVKPSNLKRGLRIMDHVNIYFLIAGTYTPFCLVISPKRGVPLLILVWSIVILGVLFKLFFWGRLKPFHTLIYLAMGWIIVFYIKDIRTVLPPESGVWILGGGLSYTVGTLFYASKKIPYYHAIWHLFVVAGSGFFWGGIYLHVLPLMGYLS